MEAAFSSSSFCRVLLFSACCKRTGQPLVPEELFHGLLKSIQSNEEEKGEAKTKSKRSKHNQAAFQKFLFHTAFCRKENGIFFLCRMLFSICSKQQSSHQEEMHTEKYLFQNSKHGRGKNALELTVALRGRKIDRQREKKQENEKDVCFSSIMQSSPACLLA